MNGNQISHKIDNKKGGKGLGSSLGLYCDTGAGTFREKKGSFRRREGGETYVR